MCHPRKSMDLRETHLEVVVSELLEVHEARARLRLGHTKFYELLRTSQVRSVKIGSRRLIPAEALDEYIAALARSSGAEGAKSA